MQPGLEQPPTSNAGKLKLLDALLALIDSNKLSVAAKPQVASAKPEYMDTGNQQSSVATIPTAPTVAELPVSATRSRKLVFDGANIDKAGAVVALTRVYMDGHLGFYPFIKYFPVPQCVALPDEFTPEEEQAPKWEKKNYRDYWDKQRDVAFEVCRQAYALQQAVNAKAHKVERSRAEEARQSKKKSKP